MVSSLQNVKGEEEARNQHNPLYGIQAKNCGGSDRMSGRGPEKFCEYAADTIQEEGYIDKAPNKLLFSVKVEDDGEYQQAQYAFVYLDWVDEQGMQFSALNQAFFPL